MFFKTMLVTPGPVWPAPLFINKTPRRFPGRDFTFPAKRQTMHSQSVFDPGAGLHPDR
jgi:hypothetical protein